MARNDQVKERALIATLSLEWTGTVTVDRDPIRFIVQYVHIHPKDVIINPKSGDDATCIATKIETAWKTKFPSVGYPVVERTGATLKVTYSTPAAKDVPEPNRVELVVVPASDPPPKVTVLDACGEWFKPYADEDLKATVVDIT